MRIHLSTSAKQITAVKPPLCEALEAKFQIKFGGPFNDGREWGARIKCKTLLDVFDRLQEIKVVLQEKGITQPSTSLRSMFSFKVDRKTDLGIDVVNKIIDIVVYID